MILIFLVLNSVFYNQAMLLSAKANVITLSFLYRLPPQLVVGMPYFFVERCVYGLERAPSLRIDGWVGSSLFYNG